MSADRAPGRRGVLRGLAAAAALALTAPAGVLLAVPAAADPTGRFFMTAQGDAMFYAADSNNVPGSPKNEAGSLTARAEGNSAGNSYAFAGAPYGGPTVTTAPGTATGLAGGATGVPFPVPLPFTTLPGFVSARFPSEPKGESTMGPFSVSAEATEFASKAKASNGAPPEAPAPNQQQSGDASVIAKDDGTVISSASSAVSGLVVGPLSAIKAQASAVLTENGNRKPVVKSSASGSFEIAGMGVVFDRKGFRIAGQDVPTKDGLAMINSLLANANVKLEAVPETTQVSKASGATIYTLGGLQMTTAQDVSGQTSRIVYTFARVEVVTVSVPAGKSGVTQPPVITPVDDPGQPATTGTPPVSSGGDAGLSPGSTDGAVSAPVDTAVPPVVDAGSTGDTAPVTGGETAPVAEAPRVLGNVASLGAPVKSESQLLYLVLVLGGVGAFVGSQLFSRFGILLGLRQVVAGR